MRTSELHVITPAIAVAGDGVAVAFPVSTTELLPFEWLTVLARVDVETGATATFTVELSHDNSEWFTCNVHDLAAAAAKDVQAASVAVAADGSLALLGLSVYAPFVRVNVSCAGAAATVTLYALTLS